MLDIVRRIQLHLSKVALSSSSAIWSQVAWSGTMKKQERVQVPPIHLRVTKGFYWSTELHSGEKASCWIRLDQLIWLLEGCKVKYKKFSPSPLKAVVRSAWTQHSMVHHISTDYFQNFFVFSLVVLDMPTFHFLPPNQMLYSDLCHQFHMN